MALKIDQPITGWEVSGKQPEVMHEVLKRPEVLEGKTYKIKPPTENHALYITINNIVINAGTEHEKLMPFEIFAISKSMESFQWIVALTLVITAIFRKGGDVAFLVHELKPIFDPKGGYFRKGGKFMPSVVAEIGHIIEQHLIEIGAMQGKKLDAAQAKYVANKLADSQQNKGALCAKCGDNSVVILDGCATCVSCGESKCG